MAKRKSPKQRKEERQQEKQRGQQRIFIGVAVIVAIFAAIIFALTSLPADAEIPTGLDRYQDFMTSTTDEGYAVLGNPNAPVTVREFSSFSCAGCADFHRTTFPQLLPAIENGAISFVFIPLQTGSVANPEGASRTAICAGEQGMFWEMHDTLFSWTEVYGTTAFQDSRIRTGVQELGMNTGDFNSCFRSNSTSAVLTAAQNEGVTSTPSIEVNGVLLPNTSFETISDAITNNLGTQTNFESGLISDASDDVEMDDTEATEEAEIDDTEATEEAEMDDTEATEEADVDNAEATEEAEMDDMEATEEAESE